jgi:hypothetical protein
MRTVCVAMRVLLCSAAVGAEVPPPWQAQNSWPGGPQYDARLDRTVQFWGAALPLATVFAGVEQQTGVRVTFSHADDANERVCVNLYLNPTQPPTLRELLTQLSWVTQCTFLYLADQPARYVLLSSDAGRDVNARVDRAQQEARAAHTALMARYWEGSEAVLAQLDGLRAALALTREQAIARYRGSNDRLLITLLRPSSRTALQVACALTTEQRGKAATATGVSFPFTDLPADVQAQLAATAGLGSQLAGSVQVLVAVGDSCLWVMLSSGGRSLDWHGATALTPGLVAPGSREELSLRAALGEPIDLEAEDARELEASRRRDTEARARFLAEFEAKVHRSAALSPEAEARLGAWAAPWAEGATYPLWQVQEAAARATGLHVVSDCFDQPSGRPYTLATAAPGYGRALEARQKQIDVLRLEHPDEWQALLRDGGPDKRFPRPVYAFTLREWLTALCYPPREGAVTYPDEQPALGWDWGDAGSFLRFRSQHADVWRAALLPPSVLPSLDAALVSWVEKAKQGDVPEEARFPLSVSAQIALVKPLDDVQLHLGGLILREDPTTPKGAARDAYTRRLWDHLSDAGRALRFLATLDGGQRPQLLGPGLDLSGDLTAEQRGLSVKLYFYLVDPVRGPTAKGERLLMTALSADPSRRPRGVDDITTLRISRVGPSGAQTLADYELPFSFHPAPEKPAALPPFVPASP